MWQGYWVAFVGIPAFIVTLAGMLIFRGAAMITLGNTQISPFPAEFRSIASGYMNGYLGGAGYDVFTLVIGGIAVALFAVAQWRARMARIAYKQAVEAMPLFIAKIVIVGVVVMAFAQRLAFYKGLPVVLLILGLLVVIYVMIMKRTVFGRHVYAIGGNLHAATLSGIKVKWVNFWIFINMGVLSALAGVVFTARLNLANPKAGTMFELDAIAAAFIGGAAVTGGIGTVVGAIVGGLIMGVMNNGMSLMGIGIDYQQAIKGLVLLLAVAFDVWNKRRVGAAKKCQGLGAVRPASKNSGTAVPKKLGPDAEKSASGPSLICALRQFCAPRQRRNYSMERIVQLVRWLSPGSITMRLVPELNASGGQVMGSTASPRRSFFGSGRSAVCPWTHGAVDGQLISAPVPRGSRTRTVAVPLLSRLTLV